MMGFLEIDSVIEADGWEAALGESPDMLAKRVVRAVAAGAKLQGAVSVLFADDAAVRVLNKTWCGKDAPTNVLSFPAPEGFGMLGDIALALDTITAEAGAQGKTVKAHTSHLIAHGVLHLIGHDHVEDAAAEKMEMREREILASLGIADPYGHRS